MLSINTNLSSLIAQSSMKQSTNKLNQAIERMTTGFKINHAKDNAANYSIATNMTTKIGAYNVAEDNAAMGLDLISTASDSLDLISEHIRRIRDLAEQAANGTYDETSLKAIQKEAEARLEEIKRLTSTTEYNGVKVLEGEIIESGVTGKFLGQVTQLTEEEAIAEGYTIIKTADELQAMKDDLNGKYILMNDIDLSGYNWEPIGEGSNWFMGELNGNGFVIENLTLNMPTQDYVGLFGSAYRATIKNLGLENVDIIGKDNVGALWASGPFNEISNCYVTGHIEGNSDVGAINGNSERSTLSDCYVSASVSGNSYIGAFMGYPDHDSPRNCYYNTDLAGGLTAFGRDTFAVDFPTEITTSELNALIIPTTIVSETTTTLQVGINSNENSRISVTTTLDLGNLNITLSSPESARSALSELDSVLKEITAKQTEFGAAQNRLESVLEEITIQRDNLVSSRSTIRDADIAEVSATYIQQQILQQASATLLATANQNPSIALQLI